jgi:hypothetical protein
MSGAVVGLAAAIFLTVSPFHIYLSQETRMYTLLAFNAAAAIYALVRLLTDPRSASPIGGQLRESLQAWRTGGEVAPQREGEFSYRPARPQSDWAAWITRRRWPPIESIETDLAWAGLIVFSAATLYSHNTAVFFLAATNIFMLGLMLFQRTKKSGAPPAFRAPSLANWVKAQIGILILWSPWIIPFIKQASRVDQEFWIPKPTWEAAIQTLKAFLNASAPMPSGMAITIWSLYGLVLCLGLVFYRKKISLFLFLGTLFAIPFVGELIVSIRRPIFYARTLIWITIPLFLLLAAGAAQLRYRFLIFGVVGILGTLNLFSTGDYFRFYQKEDWHTPAGYVSRFAEQGDLVLFNSNFVVIPFNYYFRAYEERYHIQVEKQGVPLDLFGSSILEPKMTADNVSGLISKVSRHKRVWLVYSHDSYTDPLGLIPQTLASQKELVREREFYGGRVQLYVDP